MNVFCLYLSFPGNKSEIWNRFKEIRSQSLLCLLFCPWSLGYSKFLWPSWLSQLFQFCLWSSFCRRERKCHILQKEYGGRQYGAPLWWWFLSVLIQITARTLWEHSWLSAQCGWGYPWRTVPSSELPSCGASSPAVRTAFWLLDLLLGIWHLCGELGSEASCETGNTCMAKVRAALTISVPEVKDGSGDAHSFLTALEHSLPQSQLEWNSTVVGGV